MVFDSFDIKSLIRPVIDFPKPGVIFRDITPLFQSPTALRLVMDSFAHRYVEAEFTHIGAMDARGFLIGSILAYQLNKPLILFRKQGKLPADVLAEGYQTEYGEAFLEVHADSLCEGDSVVMFDDLIATGGTLIAAANLIRRHGRQGPRSRGDHRPAGAARLPAPGRHGDSHVLPDAVLAQRKIILGNETQPLWSEPARDSDDVSQHRYWLIYRYREQARSHKGLVAVTTRSACAPQTNAPVSRHPPTQAPHPAARRGRCARRSGLCC